MATVYSGWVGGDDWQVRLDYNVVNVSNTQCRVDCTAYVVSKYGSMNNSTHCVIYCDGQQSTEVTNANFGTWGTKALQSWSFTVARPNGTDGRTISVSARIWALYGPSSYATGATASGSASIPARQYLKPNPPASFAASRVSDAQMSLTWRGDYTGMNGDRPWAGIYVDRRTDYGNWQNIANLDWDAINYTDNSTSANHKYEYRLCAYGPGGNSDHVTAAALYTTPAAPASVAVSRVSGTSVRVSADVSTAPYAGSFEVQRNLNSGGWEAVGEFEMFPITNNAGGGTAVYRVRSVIGSLHSAWTESDPVTTIVSPLAPSVTVAGGASVVPTGTDLVVTWVPNHPDGSAQEAAKVVLMQGASVVGTYTVNGSATSYDLGAVSTAGSYRVRVQTKGADPDWGGWSGWVSVTVAVPPSVHFSAPPVDGAAVGALPLTVEWDVTDSTGVASQSIALLDASGRTLYSAEPGPQVRELVLGDSTYRLSNATDYKLRITVRGGSSLTATAERSFRTSFAEPASPTARAATDPSDMSVAVSVQAGAASSASGKVIEVPATPGTLVPGLTVYGATRQNLWVNPNGTANGVTATANANGNLTVSGTAHVGSAVYTVAYYVLRPSSTYTVSCNKRVSSNGKAACFTIYCYASDNSVAGYFDFADAKGDNDLAVTFTVPSTTAYIKFGVYTSTGATVSGTYRVMLNEGTEAQPWCPPGLNGVDELSVVTAGKNLAKMRSVSYSGINATVNEDGSMTINGTTANTVWPSVTTHMKLPKGEDVTLSIDRTLSGTGVSSVYLAQYYADNDSHDDVITLHNNTSGTYTIPDDSRGRTYIIGFGISSGTTVVNQTFRVQLELGSTATAYEPPAYTTTPVDLDGHALHSLPDGTHDELRIDGTGAVTLVRRIGVVDYRADSFAKAGSSKYAELVLTSGVYAGQVDFSPERQVSDFAPIGNADSVRGYPLAGVYTLPGVVSLRVGTGEASASGAAQLSKLKSMLGSTTWHHLYSLATPQEVELPGISMPSFPADPSTVFCASDVPCTVRVDYPATSSLTVQRVAPDGSRWTVADGLLSGQQAIDPLPPLNVPYSYEVTASTEAGSAYTTIVEHTVDAGTKGAYNFGPAAAECLVTQFDFEDSGSADHGGELYHFAGQELPLFYAVDQVDVSSDQSFHLIGRDIWERCRALFRKYPVCWARKPDGGRQRIAATASIDTKACSPVAEVSVSGDEIIFEEAW